MASATFAEIGHVYQDDGVIVPSVTQVLTLAGISDVSGIPFHILEKASQIGTAVHQACEFLDQDDLSLESLDEQIVGYVAAYQKFRQETEFKPELIEHRIIARYNGLKYGMCVDRTGLLNDKPTVLDLKTSSKKQASWAIQTAAYAIGLDAEYERGVVHLAKDGTYKLIPYDDPRDYETWDAALYVAHWKLGNGAKLK
jgi:hypothetical protein